MTNAATATAALARKMEPHQKYLKSTPPASGPSATPIPALAVQPAIAPSLDLGVWKTSTSIDKDAGTEIAAPTPISTLPRITTVLLLAKSATTEPKMKLVKPLWRTILRPWRSARYPPTTIRPANAVV